MRLINRKLLRDLGTAKGLFIGVGAVLFLGVAFFGASYMAFLNLKTSYDYSYQALHFDDYTVKVVAAPQSAVDAMGAVPGVEAATGRLNVDLPLNLPGSEITVQARVISLAAPARSAVNDVKIESGSYFSSPTEMAVLVEKSFADHHNLSPGDTISLVVGGKPVSLSVAGIATSPEYIFAAKSRQELLVSPNVFGVIFMPEQTLAGLIGNTGVNEFCFTVAPGASGDSVLNQVEGVLGQYNILEVVPRDQQPSNSALNEDLSGFGEIAQTFPVLFLLIGALATYILITRLVQNQRTQIGLMRAMGYSRRTVLSHYLNFALIIGVSGAILGAIAGFFLSGAVTRLYIHILGLPFTIIRVNWAAIAEGMAVGIIPSVIAGIFPALTASKLTPAEAMRPPAPPRGRTPWLERLLPFLKRLPFMWKLPFRNAFRNRNRSLSVVLGVAFGLSLIIVSSGLIDSVDAIFKFQFEKTQKYAAEIDFVSPQPLGIISTVAGWNGIKEAQPVIKLPARFESSGNTYDSVLMGLQPGSDLYGLFDTSSRPVVMPTSGVLLAEGMKDILKVSVGDTVTVRTASGSADMTVAGFVKQPMGSSAYSSLATAQSVAGGSLISGVMVSADAAALASLRSTVVAALPGASVEVTTESRAAVQSLFNLINTVMLVMLAFGAGLSLAIVFTMVSLSIIERRREVATMRTLGERRSGITAMLTIENLMLGLAGLIPGLLLGYGLARYLFTLFKSDLFSFDLMIYMRTYLLGAGLVVFIVLISQIPGVLQINRLDLAKVIKEQER